MSQEVELNKERTDLEKHLQRKYADYKWAQFWWSVAYHGTQYIIIISSFGATIILSFFPNHTALAAGLTTLAGVLTTVAKGSGFDKKWRVNRISRSRTEQLQLNPLASQEDIAAARKQLQEIIGMQDEVITDEKTEKGEEISKRD